MDVISRPAALAAGPATQERWRRKLTIGLGLLWLVDAGLQFQPYMFTTSFPNDIIKPASDGSPAFVTGPGHWAANLMAGHIGLWNSLFALTQLVIGAGLLVPRTAKRALAASILWALGVWWLGEGLGGILSGPVSPVAGMPGAVVLYALVAVLLRPRTSAGPGRTVAAAGPLGRRGAAALWLLLWVGFAFEALRPANRSPSALAATIQQARAGEPSWIKAITRPADVLAGHGTQASIALAVIFAVIAVAALRPALARTGVAIAIAVALLIWVFGQSLGGIATGEATDPNSGPVLALLALCFWPLGRPAASVRLQPQDDRPAEARQEARAQAA